MQTAINSFLKFTSLRKTVFWDYYSLSNKNSIQSKYPIVPLKEVITQRKEFLTIDDTVVYKRCRVQVQGKGVVLRDEIIGKEIKTKKQQLCKTDDFLVAEIDAKVGGYGIVPDFLENAIVSGHYFLFEIDKRKLLPEYLGIVVKMNDFAKQVKSTGSTNYAAIRPYHVLEYLIPLPSIAEQAELIKSFLLKNEEAQSLNESSDILELKTKDYLSSELGIKKSSKLDKLEGGLSFVSYKDVERWSLSFMNRNQKFSFKEVRYEVIPIKLLLKSFDGGKTPSTSQKDFWNGNLNWFSAKDMKSLFLKESEDKITSLAVENSGMKIHPKGTILGVFRSGILRHSFPVAILQEPSAINQDLKAMSFDNARIINEYALFYLHLFQEMILEQAQKTGVTVESINTEEFLEIPVVLPPLDVQTEIACRISKMKSEISELNEKADDFRKMALEEFQNKIFKN